MEDIYNIKRIEWKTFCTEDMLGHIEEFQRHGLMIEPSDLIFNFEDTIDYLSLPCENEGYPDSMSSVEFLVDSAASYWRKCQQGGRYKDYRKQTTGKAVARMSECVHGSAWKLYDTFNEETCSTDEDGRYTGTATANAKSTISETRRWIADSYCGRLKNFKALLGCFSG